MTRELTDEQIRVLGALVEKERTTPDHYPLTTNALVAACNQRNNRDPVVAYDDRLVDATMLSLRESGLARTVRPTGNRAHKHRHVLAEAWALDGDQLAVLAVLMLRGPQTAPELRTRTERYSGERPVDVEAALASLAALDEPLAVDIGRAAGQSQDRWTHLAGGTDGAAAESGGAAGSVAEPASSGPAIDVDRTAPSAIAARAPVAVDRAQPAVASATEVAELRALRERVAALEDRLARLERDLGY